MACSLTAGYSISCGQVTGGIRSLLISETDAVDIPAGTAFAEADSLITTIDAQTFYEFELKRELSSFTNTITREAANGTVYNAQQLSAVFLLPADTPETIADVMLSVANGRRNVWVLDNNQNLYLAGARDGLEVTTIALETGTSYGDMVGYRMEMTGSEKTLYYGTFGTDAAPFGGVTGITVG